MLNGFVTINTAALELGRDRSTLSKAIAAGKLRARLVADVYLISRRDLKAYIRKRDAKRNRASSKVNV